MPPWPTQVLLEVTNACDLACRDCHFHGAGVVKTRPVGSMASTTWRRAIDEIAGWNTPLTIQPWGMGEPLLHAELWELVRTAKAHAHLSVGFYSNGMQWRPVDFAAAIASGLDWVCFSVDGLDAAKFAEIRRGGDLDRVLGTVRSLAAARAAVASPTPRIRINTVDYPDAATASDFVPSWLGIADTVTVSRFRPVGSRRFSPIELPRVPCYQLDAILAVAWNGDVAMCCEDPQVAEPVGRFPEQSLCEIWNGERMQALRAAHRDGDFGVSRLCRDCDAWTGIYERPGQAPGMTVTERTAATIYTLPTSRQDAGHP